MRANLTSARNQKNLTIRDISAYLGITERQYRYIEAGKRGTNEENWIILFKLFDEEVPLHELMETTA